MYLSGDSYLKFGPYRETLIGIQTSLQISEGIIKVIGPEGSGKSALCRQLVAELQADNQTVIYFDTPPATPDALP